MSNRISHILYDVGDQIRCCSITLSTMALSNTTQWWCGQQGLALMLSPTRTLIKVSSFLSHTIRAVSLLRSDGCTRTIVCHGDHAVVTWVLCVWGQEINPNVLNCLSPNFQNSAFYLVWRNAREACAFRQIKNNRFRDREPNWTIPESNRTD